MPLNRQVITALERNGTDKLGINNLALKLVDETSIVSGSLLTVESNHFCIVKSRDAVLAVYDTGQYSLVTPDKPIIGSIVQGVWGGNAPWAYEIIYVNRAKLLVSTRGEDLVRRLGRIEGQVRAQPVPENDRMTQRARTERAALRRLLDSAKSCWGDANERPVASIAQFRRTRIFKPESVT